MKKIVDVDFLKKMIGKKGKTLEGVAKAIGVDRSTLFRKMKNGGEGFTVKDIKSMTEYIPLDNDEAKAIFFTDIVA